MINVIKIIKSTIPQNVFHPKKNSYFYVIFTYVNISLAHTVRINVEANICQKQIYLLLTYVLTPLNTLMQWLNEDQKLGKQGREKLKIDQVALVTQKYSKLNT